jgi:ketosteroid isomerase-like protein
VKLLQNSKESSDLEEVAALERELIQAFVSGDIAVLDTILAEGFIFTDPQGPPIGKSQWMHGLETGRFRFESVEIENLDVKLFGDTALANGRIKIRAAVNGSYNGSFHYTDVYVKHGGHWKAILSTALGGGS